jgi:hypothetical protein
MAIPAMSGESTAIAFSDWPFAASPPHAPTHPLRQIQQTKMEFGKQSWRLKPLDRNPEAEREVSRNLEEREQAVKRQRALERSLSRIGGTESSRPRRQTENKDKYPNQTIAPEQMLILHQVLDTMLSRERAALLPPGYLSTLQKDVSVRQVEGDLIRTDKSAGSLHGVSFSPTGKASPKQTREIKDPILENFINQAVKKAERLQHMKGHSFQDKLALSTQVSHLGTELEIRTDDLHQTAQALGEEREQCRQLGQELDSCKACMSEERAEMASLQDAHAKLMQLYNQQTKDLAAANEELEDLREPDPALAEADPLMLLSKRELREMVHAREGDIVTKSEVIADMSGKNEVLLKEKQIAMDKEKFFNAKITEITDQVIIAVKHDANRIADLEAPAGCYDIMAGENIDITHANLAQLVSVAPVEEEDEDEDEDEDEEAKKAKKKAPVEELAIELDIDGDPVGSRFFLTNGWVDRDPTDFKSKMDATICRWANALLYRAGAKTMEEMLLTVDGDSVNAMFLIRLIKAIDPESLDYPASDYADYENAPLWDYLFEALDKLYPGLEYRYFVDGTSKDSEMKREYPPSLAIGVLTFLFSKMGGMAKGAERAKSDKEAKEGVVKELEEVNGMVRKMKAALQSLSSSLTGEQIGVVVGRALNLKKMTSAMLLARTESCNKFLQTSADTSTYLMAHQLPVFKSRPTPDPQIPAKLAEKLGFEAADAGMDALLAAAAAPVEGL